jgi:hypothetical protein
MYYGNTEIQIPIPEVVISIYDVYELEKSIKEYKIITHLLKGLKDEML